VSWQKKKKRRSRYLPKQVKNRTTVIMRSNVAVGHDFEDDITHRRGGVLIYASRHAEPPLGSGRPQVLPARLPRGGYHNVHYGYYTHMMSCVTVYMST
jgi:hypothetical protein